MRKIKNKLVIDENNSNELQNKTKFQLLHETHAQWKITIVKTNHFQISFF